MKRKFLTLLISLMLFLISSVSSIAQEGGARLEGTWKMYPEGKDLDFEFSIVERKGKGNMNTSIVLKQSELTGFNYGKDVTFSLKKTGGDITMTGDLTQDHGEGSFVYTPAGDFVKSLADEGFKGISTRILLLFTLKDADAKYVKSIKNLGYEDLSENDLITLVALEISPAYIREIQNSGYKNIPLSKIISFKALQIDPAYVASMKKLSGGDLSEEDIISFAALKVDEKYVEEMYKSGYKLSGDALIQFKAMGISPQYIKDLKDTGIGEISHNQIVELKAQNISPEYIKEVMHMGFKEKITVSTIVQFKIFKIDKAYTDQIKAAGYADLPPDKVVEFMIFKIDKAFIEKATQFVGSRPTSQKLIELRIAEGNAPR